MKLRLTVVAMASAMCAAIALARADNNNRVDYGIEMMTKRFVAAYKSRDVSSIRRILTADFTWKRPDGTSLNASQAMEGLQRQLNRVVNVEVMTIQLENVSTLGDAVSATAVCSFRGSIRDSKGSVKKVTSISKYKYYWIRAKKGWRIDGITDLNP